ncbi:MAG: hypothetical protein OHK006_14100 [Thermodesulfovibrionales bacterium]
MKRQILLRIAVLLVMLASQAGPAAGAKWEGVDEAVVEKVAREQGREARAPYIDTDQGDLLLFLFLLAGAAGGFVAGYSWRRLTERKNQDAEPR